MKKEAVLDYFIHNGKLISTNNMDIFDSIHTSAVYEVMKVIDGIPVYFDEHMQRMKKSLSSFNIQLTKTDDEILKEITQLVEENKSNDINVKLVFDFEKSPNTHFLTYFIHSEYPEEKAYTKGIHVTLFKGERENPNIKTVSGSFRERVKKAQEERKAYEALLVDEEGNITEGSRSNVFFIKDNALITPPNKKVLLGVTRSYVFKICNDLGIDAIEEAVQDHDVEKLQGAFITGTTVDILPIASIDNIQLMTAENEIMRRIIEVYSKEIKKDMKKRKKHLKSINTL